MSYYDMPITELETYLPDRDEPPDFDDFWHLTLEQARQHPLDAQFTPVTDSGLVTVAAYDVSFSGYGGQRIKGWFLVPAGAHERLPAVVVYLGYGGGRSLPLNWLVWPNAGYACLVMDTRGQGSVWSTGDTPDLPDGANPSYPGFLTQGILDPKTYYYRRLFTDAVRAVAVVRGHDAVDAARVAVTGASQGGGLAQAVAGLVGTDISACLPDVPFLTHFHRALGLAGEIGSYQEIVRYLRVHRDQEETVFRTLSYFDGLNFAARIKCPCLYSVALMDLNCPPSTVMGAYNHISAAKQIEIYRYNMHEGGQSFQQIEQMRFLRDLWGD